MDNFQAYGEFARVYDIFQDNVDYQAWAGWLKQQLFSYGIQDGLVPVSYTHLTLPTILLV